MGPTLATLWPNEIDAVTIEATYYRDPDTDGLVRMGFDVFGWGEYPEDSVLAGQTMKLHLASFSNLADALDIFPNAHVVDPFDTGDRRWPSPA